MIHIFTKIIFILLSLIIFYGCAIYTSKEEGELSKSPSYSRILVGTWCGSHYFRDDDAFYSWETEYFNNGTYTVKFYDYYIGTENLPGRTESGKWWVKDGLLCKIIPVMDEPDIYRLKILNHNLILYTFVAYDKSVIHGNAELTFWMKRLK